MARIFSSDALGYDVANLYFSSFFDGVSYEYAPTQFRINYETGVSDIFKGTGFRYDDEGVPSAGMVTSYTLVQGGKALFRVDGGEVDATDIVAAARTNSVKDDIALIKQLLSGDDVFKGAGAKDVFNGLGGDDQIFGFGGNDRLSGGAGDDVLWGGLGNDVLSGGSGRDIFSFDTKLGPLNVDRITDFNVKQDVIELDRIVFKTFEKAGALSDDNFVVGGKARDASDHILYNAKTGALFYDVDGAGGKAAVQFATLQPGLDLDASHFNIV